MNENNNNNDNEVNKQEEVLKAFEKAWKMIKALKDDGGEE